MHFGSNSFTVRELWLCCGIAADCRCGGPELADLAQQVDARRRQNQARLMTSLYKQGVLRSGLSFQEATDVLWALTSFDLYCMLVMDRKKGYVS